MKHKASVLALCLLASYCSVEVRAELPTTKSGSSELATVPGTPVPWTLVGTWRCTHPSWHDDITIFPDGTFSRAQDDIGHWSLSGLQGRSILVLAWKDWPPETVIMNGPDDFRGNTRGVDNIYGELVMHRVQPPVASSW